MGGARLRARLMTELSAAVTAAEVAEDTGVPVATVEQILDLQLQMVERVLRIDGVL
jgi:DNA-directed RNA polymerase specialized sigma24 family protein